MQIEVNWKRFQSKVVKKESGCWEWSGSGNGRGYGKHYAKINGKHSRMYAHRLSFLLHNGWLSDSVHIMHSCDNPPCVNPEHLSAGTHTDNMQDMMRKGRGNQAGGKKTHCKRGHDYSLHAFHRKDGCRECRICAREFRNNWKRKNKEKTSASWKRYYELNKETLNTKNTLNAKKRKVKLIEPTS